MDWFRCYLCILIAATLAVVPFPTPRSLVSIPSHPLPRHSVLGYDRKEFFGDWGTLRSGCSTREAIMADAWAQETCTIPYRQWDQAALVDVTDPYTGEVLDPADVEVDHIIPLRAAWDLGAYTWPEDKRTAFANDPINLVVTSRAANQAKSDMLPSEWLPPDKRVRCAYGERIVSVARKYEIALPPADVRAIRRQCSGLRVVISNGTIPVHSVE